jgi:hypothetical protein
MYAIALKVGGANEESTGLKGIPSQRLAVRVSRFFAFAPESPAVFVATVVVGFVVAAVAIVGAIMLNVVPSNSGWAPVLQDIVKTAYGALAVGALGGLLKLVIDAKKSKDLAESELRERRRSFIRDVISARNQVDSARMRIRANRSVKTWSEAVNDSLVPARTHILNVSQELSDATVKPTIFPNFGEFRAWLDIMYHYLDRLIEEYADNKQPLSELQRSAEAAADATERQGLLKEVWSEMLSLGELGDLLREEKLYRMFGRASIYVQRGMRRSLLPQSIGDASSEGISDPDSDLRAHGLIPWLMMSSGSTYSDPFYTLGSISARASRERAVEASDGGSGDQNATHR